MAQTNSQKTMEQPQKKWMRILLFLAILFFVVGGIVGNYFIIQLIVNNKTLTPPQDLGIAQEASQAMPGVGLFPVKNTISSASSGSWSAPATWKGGNVPQATDAVNIGAGHNIIADGPNLEVAGMTINANASLEFLPASSVTLTSSHNVIVQGVLKMHPATPLVTHFLHFIGVNEGNFQGGGMTPIDNDIGLWVIGAGKLDLTGTAKSGWLRATASIKKDDKELTLESAPAGWQAGDEIAFTPTAYGKTGPGDFETRKIVGVAGTKVSFDTGAQADHPVVSLPNGKSLGAEVMNLTRNVRIEGNPPQFEEPGPGQVNTNGRTHVWIHNDVPSVQTVQNVQIRYTGPRKYDLANSKLQGGFVIGRYGLHFHESGDTNVGTVVQGVVIRDSGSHGYVPHSSHSITFRDDVVFNSLEEAYWWDQRSNEPGIGPCGRRCANVPITNNTLYDHDIAALIKGPGYRLSAFMLLRGTGNTALNSVAVGVQGLKESSGFQWPEGASSPSSWKFDNNVAHNNAHEGYFVWENSGEHHVITNSTAYHNGDAGIFQGAYSNIYVYQNMALYQNNSDSKHSDGMSAEVNDLVVSHGDAVGSAFTIDGANIDGGGSSQHALGINHHNVPPHTPVRFSNWNITGLTGTAIDFDDNPTANGHSSGTPTVADFVCIKVNGHNLDLADFSVTSIDKDDVLRVQQTNDVAFQLTVQNNKLVKQTITSFTSCGK